MSTDAKQVSHSILLEGDLTEAILGAPFKVQNTLGVGFLEKVYENALNLELGKSGLFIERQKRFPVRYEGTAVGDYQADLVIARKVVVECKAASNLDPCMKPN